MQDSMGSIGADQNGGARDEHGDDQREEQRPALPPRPSLLQNQPSTARSPLGGSRPTLQAKPTTALSSVDIQTLSFPDGSRGTFSTPASLNVSESTSGLSGGQSIPSRKVSHSESEVDDNVSLISFAPTLRANGDLASLLDEGLDTQSPARRLLSTQMDSGNHHETVAYDTSLVDFEHEFDEVEAIDTKRGNEG